MYIYYRWQGKLFGSTDKNKGWDVTFKVKPDPLGVYIYQLNSTIKDTGEKRKLIGKVTLVR